MSEGNQDDTNPTPVTKDTTIRVTIRRFGKRGGMVVKLPKTEEELLRLAEENLGGGGSPETQEGNRFVGMRTPPPQEAKIAFDLIKEGDILCFTTLEQEKEFDD